MADLIKNTRTNGTSAISYSDGTHIRKFTGARTGPSGTGMKSLGECSGNSFCPGGGRVDTRNLGFRAKA